MAGIERYGEGTDGLATIWMRTSEPEMLLLGLLPGCLINEALYQRSKAALTDHDGDSFVQKDDCDDDDASISPDAVELCNGADDDCNGQVDEDADDAAIWFSDADGDGFGSSAEAGTSECDAPAHTVATAGDCDDAARSVNPDAQDSPYDGVDQDCDGADLIDVDGDGDPATAASGADCDDENSAISSLVAEGWYDNGTDNDCDGELFDPIAWSASDSLTRIDGDAPGGELGRTLEYWEAGDCLIASATFADSARGSIYGIAGGTAGTRTVAGAGVATGTDTMKNLSALHVSVLGRVVAAQATDRDGEGMVFIFSADTLCSGATGDITSFASLIIEGREPLSWFGSKAIWLDDVDGDGVDELAVVAPGAAGGGSSRGAAYFWMNPGDGLTTDISSADLVLTGSQDGSGLELVTTASDLDGPGVPWLLLGQNVSAAGTTGLFKIDARAALSGAVDSSASAGLVTYAPGRLFTAVNIGDADYVGGDDIVAGVWTFGIWNIADIEGYRDEAESTNALTYDTDGEWITAVAPAGDIDGDDRADIAVLAEDWSQYTEQGQLSLVPGERKTGPIIDFASVVRTAQGTTIGDSFGYHALPVGDFDADGIADLAVAAPGADYASTGAGAIYLVPLP